MTKIDIFRNFRRFSTNLQLFPKFFKIKSIFSKKRKFLENFDRNRMFRKFDQNRNFSKLSQILTNTEFFSKVSPKSESSENLTKIEIFRKLWPNSKFFENFDQNRNFFKNLAKIEFFSKSWSKSKLKKSKFFENLTLIEI